MAIQIQGNGGAIAEVDGTSFRALRITPRPFDHGSLGHYSYGGFTGILPAALAANSEVFQFRWTDATRLCIINEIKIAAAVSTTFFAAGVPVQIDMVKSTAWSTLSRRKDISRFSKPRLRTRSKARPPSYRKWKKIPS